MRLSIITINYNNTEGLRRTLASVASQTYDSIEHFIVDGASTDGSVDVIRAYALQADGLDVKWISEPDNGIYNGMNKGIEIALGRREVDAFNRSTLCRDKNKGINRSEFVEDKHSEADRPEGAEVENKELCDYIQILNSGDIIAANDVTERMVTELERLEYPAILYGNMLKSYYGHVPMCLILNEEQKVSLKDFSPIVRMDTFADRKRLEMNKDERFVLIK